MRRTDNTRAVAEVLLDRPDDRHWGYDLSKQSGVRSGRLYPMLTKMLDAGWLADGWEDPPLGRPPRRYYTVTTEGLMALRAILQSPDRGAD